MSSFPEEMPGNLLYAIKLLARIRDGQTGEAGGDENLGAPDLIAKERALTRYLDENSDRLDEELKALEDRILELYRTPREGRVEDDFVSAVDVLRANISALKTYYKTR